MVKGASKSSSSDLDLLRAYRSDPERHASDCIYIRDHNTSEIVPLVYNDSQRILHTVTEKQLAELGIVRVFLLKARRFGGSTYVQGRFYSKTSLNFNKNAFIVAHEVESTNTIFRMAKLMQERNPIAPAQKKNNEKLLEFDNAKGTGLKSEYRLATAANTDAGRSQGVHYLHVSEEGMWGDNGQDLLNGLLQCLPDPPAVSEAFRESTAKGYGNSFQVGLFRAYGEGEHVFYRARLRDVVRHMPDSEAMFDFAWRDPSQDWVVAFIPWICHERYQRGFDTDQQRDEFEKSINDPVFDAEQLQWVESEESKLQKRYGLTLEQLHWRRWAIENKCSGNLDKFHEEYPVTVEEAFLSTGTNVYPKSLCDELESGCQKPILVGDLVVREGKTRIRRNPNGKFRMWEKPHKNETYFMCIDSGGGMNERQKREKADPDPSCIDVYNHRSGAQVAQWHGHIQYDLIADVAEMAGRLYNNATACVELQNHGYTVVADLKRRAYPMYEHKPGEPGWSTNRKTKPVMIDDLYRMARDAHIHIRGVPTVSEMRTFIEENGKYGAASGCHDERVDTAAMATQMLILLPRRLFSDRMSPQGFGFGNIVSRSKPSGDGYMEVYTR